MAKHCPVCTVGWLYECKKCGSTGCANPRCNNCGFDSGAFCLKCGSSRTKSATGPGGTTVASGAIVTTVLMAAGSGTPNASSGSAEIPRWLSYAVLGVMIIGSAYGLLTQFYRFIFPVIMCPSGLYLLYRLIKTPKRTASTYVTGYAGLVLLVFGIFTFSFLFKKPARNWQIRSESFQLCAAPGELAATHCTAIPRDTMLLYLEAEDDYQWATKSRVGTSVGFARFRVVTGPQKGLEGWSDKRWELEKSK